MKNVLIILLFLSSLLVTGQSEPGSVSMVKNNINAEEIEPYLTKKLTLNLEAGTVFGIGGHGNYAGTYIAPHLSYPLNERLQLSGGVLLTGFSTILHPDARYYGYSLYENGWRTKSFVYAEGAYRLNEKLMITGTAYHEVNGFRGKQLQNQGKDFNTKGLIMGIDYKIGENVFIRGQVEVSNGNGIYGHDPFFNPGAGRVYDPFFRNR